MSFEHKAFIFDFDSFDSELRPLLENSLRSGNIEPLRCFIISNRKLLVDPYEGDALDDDWEDMIEDKDAHQYGDFALTKYYSPKDDQGLGVKWADLQEIISNRGKLNISPFLGAPVGVDDEFFDPGKMGSYFQTTNEVSESLKKIQEIKGELADNLLEDLEKYESFLGQTSLVGKGVYVTF